jgi:hypothetical protein
VGISADAGASLEARATPAARCPPRRCPRCRTAGCHVVIPPVTDVAILSDGPLPKKSCAEQHGRDETVDAISDVTARRAVPVWAVGKLSLSRAWPSALLYAKEKEKIIQIQSTSASF